MPFDRFAVLQRGRDLTKSEFRPGAVPVAGSNGIIGFHDTAHVPAPGVTVGRSGSVGKVAIYDTPFWAHNTCLYVRDFCGNDERFAYYLLQHLDVGRYKSGASVPTLDRNTFRSLPVSVPPVDEQRQIAAVLSAVQRAIERQERLIALTAELKKALMHKLFTEGTRGEALKQTEVGPVPESWEVVPLGSLAKIGNGSTPKRDNVAYWENGSIPWLTSGKIHEGRIKKPDQYVTQLAKAECHLPVVADGSVLVAITGEGKTLGNAALVEFDTCISQHLAYVQCHRPDVVPAFLLYFLQRQYAHLRQMSVGAGSTKKALTCGLLKRYAVPVPKKDEQKLIATAFDTVVGKMNQHERAAACLRSLFRTLLHQLMTAEIRVHDLDLACLSLEPRTLATDNGAASSGR
jgi:type I restriction enzyme S subunit